MVLCALMVPIGVFLLPLAIAGGVAASGPLDGAMSGSLLRIWIAVVVLGPIIEELAFRSWLSGRAGQFVAGGAFVALYFGGGAVLGADGTPPTQDEGFATFAMAMALYLTLAIWLRKSRVPQWYVRAFPAIFWLNAIGFGTLHLANYAGDIGPALITFTIPQIAAGAMFGYARIRVGLWSAIALHVAFNAVPVTALSLMQLL